MSAETQVQLVKKVVTDWALSNDCSAVDAMIAIMEILNLDPYERQSVAPNAQAASGD